MRIPPNLNDPNGYYAELGLPPWATQHQIRKRLRLLKSAHHPDGQEPDPEKFLRISEIADVLTDPDLKRQYDNLPKGMAWIDSEVRDLIADGMGVAMAKRQVKAEAAKHFDWFAVSPCRTDGFVAQRWYVALVAVAPVFAYSRPIRVLLHDDEPEWLDAANIIKIPRSWEPSLAHAFALFAVLVAPRCVSTVN